MTESRTERNSARTKSTLETNLVQRYIFSHNHVNLPFITFLIQLFCGISSLNSKTKKSQIGAIMLRYCSAIAQAWLTPLLPVCPHSHWGGVCVAPGGSPETAGAGPDGWGPPPSLSSLLIPPHPPPSSSPRWLT